jgi:hypothetical protein
MPQLVASGGRKVSGPLCLKKSLAQHIDCAEDRPFPTGCNDVAFLASPLDLATDVSTTPVPLI